MSPSGSPQILLCTSTVAVLSDLRRQLALGGHEVAGHLLGSSDPDRLNGFRLIIVEGGDAALGLCRRLRPRLEEFFVPLLFVAEEGNPGQRLAAFEAGVDACLVRPFLPDELLAQMAALGRSKEN